MSWCEFNAPPVFTGMPMPPFFTMRLDAIASIVPIAVLCLSFATSASAHAIVVRSSPATNAEVPAGSIDVALGFNTRLDKARSRLSLEGPGGLTTPVTLTTEDETTTLGGRAEVRTAGLWKVRWQVLAADGHVTRGEVAFRVVGRDR